MTHLNCDLIINLGEAFSTNTHRKYINLDLLISNINGVFFKTFLTFFSQNNWYPIIS
jgi:hypothetical protein